MQGKNITLNAISKEDIVFINKLRNDWENKKMTLGVRYPISLENDIAWYDKIINDHTNKNIYFVIKKNVTEENVGLIQISNIDWINRNASVGIQIIREEWGKGVGSEALNLLLDYSFNILNLIKIVAEVASFNENSLRLFRKSGFEIEGQLKNQLYYHNEYHDVFVLGRFKK